jgi:hypothetical protein
MSFLLWFDDHGPIAERAIRGAAAYLAKFGVWPETIQANSNDLPAGQETITVDEHTGQAVRVVSAPYVLRSHLHVGA